MTNPKGASQRKSRKNWDIGRALLVGSPRLLLALAALVLMATTPGFFTTGTLSTVLALASIVGVLAVGQAFVLIGGGFDLSQGAMVALTAAVTAWLAGPQELNPWLALPVAPALGALLGAINGGFVAYAGVNPFVTTLSTLLAFRGAAFVWLEGLPISGVTAFNGLSRGVEVGDALVPVAEFCFSCWRCSRHSFWADGLRAARLRPGWE